MYRACINLCHMGCSKYVHDPPSLPTPRDETWGWTGFRIDNWTLQSAWIVDFAANQADWRILKTHWIVDQLWVLSPIPDCVCLDVWILSPKRNLYHRSFFQIISFFERSSFKLRCETIVIKHVAFFTIWAKLTVAFTCTCTSLPLNLHTSGFRCGCGFRFEQDFWQTDGFGKKKAWICSFAYPYSPPSWKHGWPT